MTSERKRPPKKKRTRTSGRAKSETSPQQTTEKRTKRHETSDERADKASENQNGAQSETAEKRTKRHEARTNGKAIAKRWPAAPKGDESNAGLPKNINYSPTPQKRNFGQKFLSFGAAFYSSAGQLLKLRHGRLRPSIASKNRFFKKRFLI